MAKLYIQWDDNIELYPIPIPADESERDRHDLNVYEYELPEDEVESIKKTLREFFAVYHKLTHLNDTFGINIKEEFLDNIRQSEANLSDALE